MFVMVSMVWQWFAMLTAGGRGEGGGELQFFKGFQYLAMAFNGLNGLAVV